MCFGGSFHRKRGSEEPCEPRGNRRILASLVVFVASMGQPALVRSVKGAMLADRDICRSSPPTRPAPSQVSTSLITSTAGLLVIPL
jgi:hypothetical protein